MRKKIANIEMSGEFTFEPLDMLKLTNMICESELINKAQLLQALWWPRSNWELEQIENQQATENDSRNEMRIVSMHLKDRIDPKDLPFEEIQGLAGEFEYKLFTHGCDFYQEQGHRQAQEVVERKGYRNPSLLCFISFVLQYSEVWKGLGVSFAAAIPIFHKSYSMYPYYEAGRFRPLKLLPVEIHIGQN